MTAPCTSMSIARQHTSRMMSVEKINRDNLVGPVLRWSDIAEACVAAIHEDNPDKEIFVEERASYIRLHAEGECVLRRETIESVLGRPFQMQEIELSLGSFAGRIETTTEYVRFYFERSEQLTAVTRDQQ